jgi:hypothetical protein
MQSCRAVEEEDGEDAITACEAANSTRSVGISSVNTAVWEFGTRK